MGSNPLHKWLHILNGGSTQTREMVHPNWLAWFISEGRITGGEGEVDRLCITEQFIVPIFDYDDRANRHAHLSFPNELAVLHNRAVRFMLNCSFGSHHCEMLSSLNWRPLLQGRELNGFKMVHCKFIGVLRRALQPPPASGEWELGGREEQGFHFKDARGKILVFGYFYKSLVVV